MARSMFPPDGGTSEDWPPDYMQPRVPRPRLRDTGDTPEERQPVSDPKVHLRVTRYEVSVFPDDLRDSPEGGLDACTWVVTVEDRGNGKWAVIYGSGGSSMSRVLGRDGEWDYEPLPSSREDDWLETHRFELDEALLLAREHAPKVRWNSLSAVDVLARHQDGA